MARRVALAGAIAVAIAAAGLLLSRALFRDRAPSAEVVFDAAPPQASPADAEPAKNARLPVEIVEVEGKVERRTEGGEWVAVEAGERLDPDDVIRTGDAGRASLEVGGVEVELDHGSQISVPGITATVSRVVLGQGRLSARVPSGREAPFGVSVEGAGALAESSEGEFAVLKGEDDRVTVAAIEGRARLTAQDRTVEIAQGQQSVAAPGAAPSAPQEIPTSLFLKVRRPGRRSRERKMTVHGNTTPGAVLEVNGVLVEVDAEGRFAAAVDLDEGKNRIRIRSHDVLGRERSEKLEVDVDTGTPEVGGHVTWGKETP